MQIMTHKEAGDVGIQIIYPGLWVGFYKIFVELGYQIVAKLLDNLLPDETPGPVISVKVLLRK